MGYKVLNPVSIDRLWRRSIGRRWHDLSLRSKTVIVIGLPVILLLIQSVIFVVFLGLDRNAYLGVEDAHRINADLQNVLVLVLASETAQQGYLVTGNALFNQSNEAATSGLPSALGALALTTRGNTRYHAEVVSLKNLIAKTQIVASSPTALSGAALNARLLQQVTSVNAVRTQITAMTNQQNVSARNLLGLQRYRAALGTVIAFSSFVIGILGGVLGALYLANTTTKRIGNLEQFAKFFRAEDSLAHMDLGSDEIGRLAVLLFDVAEQMRKKQVDLAEAQLFLEIMVSEATVTAIRFSAVGTIDYVSPNSTRVLGIDADELLRIGTISDYVEPGSQNEIDEAILNLIEGVTDLVDLEFGLISDRERIVRLKVSKVRVDEKTETLGYLSDVSLPRNYEARLAEREARFAAVIEASPDIIFVVDSELRIEWLSLATRSEIDFSSPERIGDDALQMIYSDDRDGFRRTMDDVRNGVSDIGVVRVRSNHAAGEQSILEIRATCVTDCTHSGSLLLVIRDVTKETKILEDLRDERERADSASQTKSEFLSRMSHELRTPLNAILGFAQLLLMDSISDTQKEAVLQIERGGKHLLELINEILDIAKIEAGKLSISLESVFISEVLTETLELVRPLITARKITVEFKTGDPCAKWVLADRRLIIQVLMNLLSNAIKYNRVGGEVRIACEEYDNNFLAVTVADTGVGISESDMKLVFTPFNRLSADAGAVEGTGIGLALSLGLMKAMGGWIDVKSVEGQGSEFTFYIAITDAPRILDLRSSGSSVASVKTFSATPAKSVVYIEDNKSNIALVKQLVTHIDGVILLHSAFGRAGIDLVVANHPDLVILDLHLPDMSGEDVLTQIRNNQSMRDVPVVILSADANSSSARRMLKLGANRYLSKPFDVAEVLVILADPHSLVGVVPTETS